VNEHRQPISLSDRLSVEFGEQRSALQIATEADDPELIRSIKRSLEGLLNTRWCASPPPPDLKELESSLVDYGIPDLAGVSLDDPVRQREFCTALERAIRRYEPRLRSVRIQMLPSTAATYGGLRFVVEAVVGHRERISFETTVDEYSAAIRLREGAPG